MKRSEKAVLAVILSAVMFIGGTVAVTAAAGVWGYVPFTFTTNGSGEEVVEGFNSTGRIVYIESGEPDPSIIIDNADLVTLAKATNELNTQFTDSLAAAVNNIGSVPKTDRVVAGEATFSNLLTAIKDSQKIPTDQTYSGTKPDSNDTETGNISAASEANLSLGTAAWVDGKLIVGTGADNNSYYAEGYTEGKYESNSIIKLGGYGTYDLTQYENYAEFALNKNIFITVNSISISARLNVGDVAGGLYFTASNSGKPYSVNYSNGILKVSANNISCNQTVSDPYEDVGSISGNASSSITVYLLP